MQGGDEPIDYTAYQATIRKVISKFLDSRLKEAALSPLKPQVLVKVAPGNAEAPLYAPLEVFRNSKA